MRVLRAEWLKWRTVRSHWVLAIVGLGIPLVVTLLTALVRSGDTAERSSVYSLVFGVSYVTAMVAGVLGAVVSAGEFGHLTIRPTFAAVPRRRSALLAKAVLALLVGAVLQLTVAVVGAHGSFLILGWRGFELDSTTPPTTVLVGSVVFVALMTMLGHALGCLMRSAPLSITTIILWPLLVESIVGALIALATKSWAVSAWMPFQAGFRLLEYGQLDLGGDGPDRLTSGLYFGSVVLGITLLSSAVTARRDA